MEEALRKYVGQTLCFSHSFFNFYLNIEEGTAFMKSFKDKFNLKD